jgi:hypothetical protein
MSKSSGGYGRGGGSNNRKIALTAKTMIDNYVKKAKEGTILSSTAYDGDGQGR